jgi:DNA-directed RNA polymerase subunit RPC12/RpoP
MTFGNTGRAGKRLGVEAEKIEDVDDHGGEESEEAEDDYEPSSIHNKAYECSNGRKIFPTTQALYVHAQSHVPEEDKIACQICGKKYCSENLLTIHIEEAHEKFRARCNKCGRDFEQRKDLEEHQKDCKG